MRIVKGVEWMKMWNMRVGKKDANVFEIVQTLRGYSQTYLKIAQTIKQTSQTYSRLCKPKQQFSQTRIRRSQT